MAAITDEAAQEIIDEAMKSGSLQQRNVVGVITGLMGSGKTTLLHHLFGLPPPGVYTSTGAVEQSFRGFLHHIINMSVDTWQRLTHKEICELLAPLIRAGMKEEDVESLAKNLRCNIDPSAQQVATSVLPTRQTTPPSPSPNPSRQHDTHGPSPACRDMIPLIKKPAEEDSTSATSLPEDVVLDLVHMIDTGGQPELMEVMPSLIHNANLALVLLDLQYGLDEHPPVNYHEDGVTYTREETSHYTSRDILLKLAATLHTKKSFNESFHLLIIATHKDCVEGDELDLKVDTLNRELCNLLVPAFQNELISRTPGIAFVLNLRNPNEDDLGSFEVIRSEVSKLESRRAFKTPTSFFVLEQDLVRYAKEKAHRQILSLEECEEVGAQLNMSHEMVVAALVLFHRQNTFLYFSRVLPGHIFVNPQVPLDIVNSIVKFRYKVNSGQLGSFPARFVDQLNDGMVSEELLSSHDISPHFQQGLYEVHHAITLFRHTFTLAPIQTAEGAASPTEDKKTLYLMMCLKPAIPEAELNKHIPQSPDTVPLVVQFSSGCVPLGCFGSTVSCLISKYGWEVARKEGTPKCLHHNIATLRASLVNVVLIDYTKYLEIHIDSSLSINDLPSNTCNLLYTMVFGAIEMVFKIMKISTDTITISPAVVCPCSKPSKKHLAIFKIVQKQYYLQCQQTTSKLDAKQLLWIYKSDASNSKPNLPLLMRMEIPEKIGAHYNQFGTHLLNDNDGSIVKGIIRTCHYDTDEITVEILRYWLRRAPTPVTWSNLTQILKSIKLNGVAQHIEQKLSENSLDC